MTAYHSINEHKVPPPRTSLNDFFSASHSDDLHAFCLLNRCHSPYQHDQSLRPETVDQKVPCLTTNRVPLGTSVHCFTSDAPPDDRRVTLTQASPTPNLSRHPGQSPSSKDTKQNSVQSHEFDKSTAVSQLADEALRPVSPKALLSPFEFKQHVSEGHAGTGELHYDYNGTLLPPSLKPNPWTGSSNMDWTPLVPRRRLSYGESATSEETECSHKTIDEPELRLTQCSPDVESKCMTWLDATAGVAARRPYHSKPLRRKPRLWLDLVDEDHKIEEAVRRPFYLTISARTDQAIVCRDDDSQSVQASRDLHCTSSRCYQS